MAEPLISSGTDSSGSKGGAGKSCSKYSTSPQIGTLIQKMTGHAARSTDIPPTSGPNGIVKETSADHLPMAAPLSSLAKEALIRANEAGIMTAAAMPCKARKKISISAEVDNAHPTDVIPKNKVPHRKGRRRPKLSPKAPPAMVSAARPKRYISSTQ